MSCRILFHLLKAPDSSVRERAAKNLGHVGDRRAIGPLTEALNDRDKRVRKAAKEALEKIQAKWPKGIEKLVELCTETGILYEMDHVNRAVEDLRPQGSVASNAVAKLIVELLECRSPNLGLILVAAEQLKPTPGLIKTVRAVESASPLRRQPTVCRFRAEIVGAGQVGWTDGTADRIKRTAARVLSKLTQTGSAESST